MKRFLIPWERHIYIKEFQKEKTDNEMKTLKSNNRIFKKLMKGTYIKEAYQV